MNWYHIKLVLRGLSLKRFSSVIKVLGITLALVPAMLIWTYVKHESGYDKHFTDSEKIFRVIRNWQEDPKFGAYTAVPMLAAMVETFPEIESGTRIWPIFDQVALVNNKVYNEETILAADTSFFNTFGMELLEGDKNTALNNSGSVVISKTMATKLFGENDAVGQTIEFEGYGFSNDNKLFTVSGIFDDFPSNSHLKGNFILTLKSLGVYYQPNATNHTLMTYLRLNSPESEKLIEQKFPEFMASFYGQEYYDYARTTYKLQPISDIHLNSTVNYNRYETAKGNKSSLYIFPALAFLILLISSFNFVNLTVSEGSSRNKIFGINKISGAGKFYFFRIYILESLILTTLALIFAAVILQIISPTFKTFVNRDLDLAFFTNPYWIGGALIFTILIGLINGIYPAILFSSKNMIGYIQNKTGTLIKRNSLQRVFQVSQFAICIFFIVGSIVIFKQLNYINSRVGQSLDKENVLIIQNADKLGSKQEVFKSELKQISGISDVSLCREVPGINSYTHWGHPVDSAAVNAHIVVYYTDVDYLSTLKMQLVEGRYFDPNFPADNRSMVLNETAVKTLGWQDNPIGKRYKLNETYTVVGVVKDIFFRSLHQEILPQGFFLQGPNSADRTLIRINPGSTAESIKSIKNLWAQFSPEREIHYNFLNDEFDFWYQSESKTGHLALILAAIAIFLSSLGLLALVLQSISSRIKEIGIRKVNGAKAHEIIGMLNSSFVKWVVVASVITTPLSWWVMNKWLEAFVYKTTLNWWIFVVAGFATLLIALLAVSWQSWKAATRNPVEALRYE